LKWASRELKDVDVVQALEDNHKEELLDHEVADGSKLELLLLL
jgi:hypothetical protein